MSKLYAELKSDKGGRVASKGGNNLMQYKLNDGNSTVLYIDYDREKNELHINDETENMIININGFIVQ